MTTILSMPERPSLDMPVTVFGSPRVYGWTPSLRDEYNRPIRRGTVLPLKEAIYKHWNIDAHVLMYMADGYRVNKRKKPDDPLPTAPMLGMIFVDVDLPRTGPGPAGKTLWTPETLEAWKAWYPTLPSLRDAGVFATMHGYRIVQLLDRFVHGEEAEPIIYGFWDELEKDGIKVDPDSKGWNRLMRLGNVRREGVGILRSPCIDFSNARPRHIESRVNEIVTPKPSPRRPARAVPPPLHVLPNKWQDSVAKLAALLPTNGGHHWHGTALALSMTCIKRGVPLDLVPAIVEGVAGAAGYHNPPDARRAAENTVKEHCAGRTDLTFLGGETALRVGAVLEKQLLVLSAPEPDADSEPVDLAQVLREAPVGQVILLATEAGSGKTHAARVVAKERATEGLKTAISVNTNDLAEEVAKDLRDAGVDVQRYFGIAGHRTNGKLTCIYDKSATAMAAGGQPIGRIFCPTCPEKLTCRAREGVEGPPGAKVVVGNHSLLGELSSFAGTKGLLVIDEPPSLSHSRRITLSQVEESICYLDHHFDAATVRGARPILDAAYAWLKTDNTHGDDEDIESFHDGDVSLRELATSLPPVPGLLHGQADRTRKMPGEARKVGAISATIVALRSALVSAPDEERSIGLVLRREMKHQDGLHCLHPNASMITACERTGRTVITDANASVHKPVLTHVLGYEPRMVSASMRDSAPVERVLFRTSSATMKGLLTKDGKATPRALELLQHAVAWARAEKTLLCTFLALLEDEAFKALIPPEWATLYYFKTRGTNLFKDFPQLVTIGVPRSNITAIADSADLFGADVGPTLVEDYARAELEQAHGRLRTCRRVVGARVAHYGDVRPTGWGWTLGEVTEVEL